MNEFDPIQERQAALERAIQARMSAALEFRWSVDALGQLHGIARYPGQESISLWILPTGDTVYVH